MQTETYKKVYLYTRFERFWHWTQTALIVLLALTGFEIHGSFTLFGFHTAHDIHIYCGWAWIILYAFIIFWLATTNEWKQYIPTTKKVLVVVKYYLIDIFRGAPHPVPKTERAKHNPLQRLTYVSIAAAILPIQMVTGFIVAEYNSWVAWGWTELALGTVAFIHMAGAFAILSFIVVHVYMTTTGHTVLAHIKAMITGWDDVIEPESQET